MHSAGNLLLAEPPNTMGGDDEEHMLREISPNSSNSNELLRLMQNTRATRCHWIEADHSTITAILEWYLRVQNMNGTVSLLK